MGSKVKTSDFVKPIVIFNENLLNRKFPTKLKKIELKKMQFPPQNLPASLESPLTPIIACTINT